MCAMEVPDCTDMLAIPQGEGTKTVLAIQPNPAFRAVFQVATTKTGSGIALIKEPPEPSQRLLLRVSGEDRGGPTSTVPAG